METYVKTIYIRRKNPTAKVPDFLHKEASKKMSSVYVKDGDILRGLRTDEERKYLSPVMAVSANDPAFAKEARVWWSELSFAIPPGEGLKLDITLYKDGPEKDTPPLDDVQNLVNYIKWRYALVYKDCANSEAELKKNRGAIFFIYDPVLKAKQEGAVARNKRDAYKIFLQVDQDPEKVEQILSVYDYVPEDLNSDEKAAVLDKLFEQDFNKFVNVATDKELEMKFFINNLVRYSVVKKIENNYVDGSKDYGNIDSFIRWLEQPENSDTRVRYEVALKGLRKVASPAPGASGVAADDVNAANVPEATNAFDNDGAGSVNASKEEESDVEDDKVKTEE